MNKIVWNKKPCEPGPHDERIGNEYVVCLECGSIRTSKVGIDFGKLSGMKYYFKWAVDNLGGSYLVECDPDDPERIK